MKQQVIKTNFNSNETHCRFEPVQTDNAFFWGGGCLALEENQAATTEERYQEILQRRKLEDVARAQAEELADLWAEVQRLRIRSFPSLDKLKHT